MKRVAALLAITGLAAADTPHEVTLAYTRGPGAEACPDEPALRAAVAERLGYDPFRERADRSVAAEVSRAGGRLRARVELRDAAGMSLGERKLDSRRADCDDLASALVLAIGLAIDPLAGTRPRPAPAALPRPSPPAPPLLPAPSPPPPAVIDRPPSPPPRAPLEVRLTIGGAGVAGTEPAPTASLRLGAGVARGLLALAVEARADLPSSAAAGGGRVQASLLAASIAPCVRARARAWTACALATGGALTAAGRGLADARSVTMPYLAAGARVAREWPLGTRLALVAHADVLAALRRAEIDVGRAEAWTTAPVAAALGLALAWRP